MILDVLRYIDLSRYHKTGVFLLKRDKAIYQYSKNDPSFSFFRKCIVRKICFLQ